MRDLAPKRGQGWRTDCSVKWRQPTVVVLAAGAAKARVKHGATAKARLTFTGFGKQREEHIHASTSGNTKPARSGAAPAPAQPASPDAAAFGPLGLLLTGFSEADARAVRGWLAPIDPDFCVSCASPALLAASLEAAVTAPGGGFRCDRGWHAPPPGTPRVALFSGVSRQQALDLAGLWHLSGVREPTFMSAVAPARDRQLLELLQEVEAHARGQPEGPKERIDPEALRRQLRARMAAKLQLGALERPGEAGVIRLQQ